MSHPCVRQPRFGVTASILACVLLAWLLLMPPSICDEKLLQQLQHASVPSSAACASLSPATPLPAASLLVIVLASDEPIYAAHRAVWRMMAAAAPRFGVRVFFTKMRDGLDAVRIEKDTVFVPGTDCVTPCQLLKTMASLHALVGPGAAPHAYEYVLRTNLSSLWVWARLLAWIKATLRPRGTPIRAGVVIGKTVWLSGAGTVLSIDAARTLVAGNESLRYTEMDDVAMSEFLHAKNVPIQVMTRADFTSTDGNPIGQLPVSPDSGAYHYRIKPVHDRARHDGYVMARLFAEAYFGGED